MINMPKNIIVSNIEIEVTRKKIKNMYLKISAHDGKVSISAPIRTKDEDIIKFATSKIHWIEKQSKRFEKSYIQNTINYADGQIHYVWGKPYVLKINKGSKISVDIIDNMLMLTAANESTTTQYEKILMDWYRRQLKSQLPYLFDKWENIIGVKAQKVTVRNMKSRWGSCNTRDNRISLNVQLAKKPIICLEYVIVHELVHILEPSHNAVFKGYMDSFLPKWREIKQKLIY